MARDSELTQGDIGCAAVAGFAATAILVCFLRRLRKCAMTCDTKRLRSG